MNWEIGTCEEIICGDNCLKCDTIGCLTCKEGYMPVYASTGYECVECYKDITQCAKCSPDRYERFCTECNVGYYLDNPTVCGRCIENCDSCSDSSGCSSCHAGYYYNGNICDKCNDNCLTCQGSATNCTRCHDGYFIKEEDNTCGECIEHCKECSATKCEVCNDGFYLEAPTKCSQCGSNCVHCTSPNTCTQCERGFYPDDESGTCQKCSDNCDECVSNTNCTDCAPEFYPDNGVCKQCADVCQECAGPTENDCINCDEGYYFSRPNRRCFKCHEGCLNCTGPNDYECTACTTGYFMNTASMEILPGVSGQKCTKCEAGCIECTSPKDCQTCGGGYRLVINNRNDRDCEPCAEGCNKCDSRVDQCTECLKEGYYVSETNSGIVKCSKCPDNCKLCSIQAGVLTCSDCIDGFYKGSDGKCERCQYPCSACTSSTSCLTCKPGHLLEGNSCQSLCSDNCLTCKDESSKCDSCHEEFVLSGTQCVRCPEGCKVCETDEGKTICRSCIDGYFKTGEECVKCESPCATCFNTNTVSGCYSCEVGYYMDKIYTYPTPYGGHCSLCSEKDSHCIECASECIDDDLDTNQPCHNFKCTKCDEGYSLSNDFQSCIQCPENCLTCTDSQTCIECKEGYMLNGTTCSSMNETCNDDRCDLDNSDGDTYMNITVTYPLYNESVSDESGGAIRLINYGITAENVTFTNCVSQKGGGGAIYIYNNIQKEDAPSYSIILTGLTFRECRANFGAAVYIFSPSETSPVQITSCIFDSNQLTSSSSSRLTGGSALYLTCKNADIVDCSFMRNKGRGGAVKISDDFTKLPEGLKLLQKVTNYTQGSIVISGCSFEIDENSDSSLYYNNERQSTKIQVKDCSFEGKLGKDAHYIDGQSYDNERPGLFIRSCKFSSDQRGALNSKFINVDLGNQVLMRNNNFSKMQTASKSLMALSTLAAVAVIAITAIIKKQDQQNDENGNERQETFEA